MTVEQSHVIDSIGKYADAEIHLLITDHLSWYDPDHIPCLIKKIETYAHAIQSKQTLETLPEAAYLPHKIIVVHQYFPPQEAILFLQSMRDQLATIGIAFDFGSIESLKQRLTIDDR